MANANHLPSKDVVTIPRENSVERYSKAQWSIITLGLCLAIGLTLCSSAWSQPTSFLVFNLTKGHQAHQNDDLTPGTVKWWKCDQEGEGRAGGAECGYIIVPLDYLNVSAGVAKVALGRHKATVMPKKGMVVFNPGGPGGPGKLMATILGPAYQNIIGKDYDFVGFDPRGIGETEPRVNCFGTPENYQLFKRNTILDRGFDVGPNLTDPRTRDHLIIQQQEATSLYKTQFEVCSQSMGDNLKYMGTTTVSRDIDFITTALEGKDALINYYAGSYGSVLGAYLVNMFPDRIGRVFMEAIVDSVAWSSTPAYKWYRQWSENSEDVYKIFFKECSEVGPTVCALAQRTNEPPSKIMKRVEDFIENLYTKPLAVPHATPPTILTSGRARNIMFEALEFPRRWPKIALALSDAMKGDGLLLVRGPFLNGTTDPSSPPPHMPFFDLARSAVSCNDNGPVSPPSAEEVIDEGLDVLKTVSRFAMGIATSEPDSGCEFWPVTPPERFQGPWNHTLKNPILIVSNTADPITPISSGRQLKRHLGDSARLVIREGPGHGTSSLASLCVLKITANYFKDGTLPANEHFCSVDESPFLPDALPEFPPEDAILIESLKTVGITLDRLVQGLPP